MTKEEFSKIAPSIPHQPGVYKYFNEAGTIIYIGKAKDLRKRVASYFNKTQSHYKTKILVSLIREIEFTIVATEQDALLLESNLIKHYQPRYNIELKDDKSYPHIVIKKEEYPRVFFTRKIIKDGSTYFGPYSNVPRVRELLEVIKQGLPVRTCNLPLTQETIDKGKYKACLEYHIGNCKAPCINAQSKEDYNWYINEIKDIFKGKLGNIKKKYVEEMKDLASNLQFEKANIVKQKIDYLEEFKSRSVIVSTTVDNIDVVALQSNDKEAVVNYMVVFNGSVVHSKTVIITKKLEEPDDEILAAAVAQLRITFSSTSKEIITEIPFETTGLDAVTFIPKLGDKRKLLDLAIQNVVYFINEIRRQKTLLLEKDEDFAASVLQEIKTNLKLTETPNHIECFDNSNFQGSFPVAAMVCFKNGLPSKADYRRFHIKTVAGIDDFASMKEIVYRRYKRLQEEQKPLPQLVIIDGGKGQLGAALQALKELNLLGKMAIVGLAKNVEELFFPGDSQSLQLPYHSDSLKLITSIRDEVHRFGITFHRNTRSKGVIKNELEDIKGIGANTAMHLLQKFKSVRKIKTLTQREIATEIGTAKARIIFEALQAKE